MLGKVEIGGWNNKFTFQNPPTKYLKAEIEKYVEWMLWLAEISPRIVINKMEVKSLEKNVIRLSSEIQNVGYLSTNITKRAIDAKLTQPVRAILELENAELISGNPRTDLGHIPGVRDANDSSTDSRKNLTFGIRILGQNAKATLTVKSEKGGIVQKIIDLN